MTLLLIFLLVYPDGHTYRLQMNDIYHHSCQTAIKDTKFQLEQTLSIARIKSYSCEEGI
jgi:hypothetical protein